MSEILQLLQQVKAGNKDAIIGITEKYMPLIRKYSNCEDPQTSEDCRQYIMMNLIIAIERFRPALKHLYNEMTDG